MDGYIGNSFKYECISGIYNAVELNPDGHLQEIMQEVTGRVNGDFDQGYANSKAIYAHLTGKTETAFDLSNEWHDKIDRYINIIIEKADFDAHKTMGINTNNWFADMEKREAIEDYLAIVRGTLSSYKFSQINSARDFPITLSPDQKAYLSYAEKLAPSVMKLMRHTNNLNDIRDAAIKAGIADKPYKELTEADINKVIKCMQPS